MGSDTHSTLNPTVAGVFFSPRIYRRERAGAPGVWLILAEDVRSLLIFWFPIFALHIAALYFLYQLLAFQKLTFPELCILQWFGF